MKSKSKLKFPWTISIFIFVFIFVNLYHFSVKASLKNDIVLGLLKERLIDLTKYTDFEWSELHWYTEIRYGNSGESIHLGNSYWEFIHKNEIVREISFSMKEPLFGFDSYESKCGCKWAGENVKSNYYISFGCINKNQAFLKLKGASEIVVMNCKD